MIWDRAVKRIETVKIMLADSDELADAGAYERAAEYANCAGDCAEAACAAFDGLADCLRSAMNANPNECERWESLADCAARLVNAAENRYAHCVNLID